ncbi:MAG: YigZ family protein [Firmicutes bacterium]|nr:YigZ family protein [Bacillota bacterium]
MIQYKTVAKEAQAEQIIDKSRFIAYVKHVESKEEADAFIASIRAMHKTATHNVPAFVIGDQFQLQWASDDGEPQGTSGAPMVQMLVKEGITNVCIVVTRYFGGIKLGTGGLVRAYTSSAKLGLEASGICEMKEMAVMQFKVDYSFLSKIQNLAQGGKFSIEDIVYEADVTLKIVSEIEDGDEVKSMFTNLTSATARLVSETTELTKKALA